MLSVSMNDIDWRGARRQANEYNPKRMCIPSEVGRSTHKKMERKVPPKKLGDIRGDIRLLMTVNLA
jgi:hypothetical protein